ENWLDEIGAIARRTGKTTWKGLLMSEIPYEPDFAHMISTALVSGDYHIARFLLASGSFGDSLNHAYKSDMERTARRFIYGFDRSNELNIKAHLLKGWVEDSKMDEALQTASPTRIIRRHARLSHDTFHVDKLNFPLKQDRRLFVIGAGKASGYMGEEIERILGKRIADGLVIIPDYLRPRPRGHRIGYHLGTHPIPSQKNTQGVGQILRLVENSTAGDLIIVLLSGGASALMDYPSGVISLEDERKTTLLLLISGAIIHEI